VRTWSPRSHDGAPFWFVSLCMSCGVLAQRCLTPRVAVVSASVCVQCSDIARAIAKTDVFDFLIDLVPRDVVKTVRKVCAVRGAACRRGAVAVTLCASVRRRTASTSLSWAHPRCR
jgi:hypothetical protein